MMSSKHTGGDITVLPFISPKLKTTIDVTKIVHYIRLELTAEFQDTAEQHDFWELVYLESGEAEAVSDDRQILLSQGDMYFHKPLESHSVRIRRSSVLHFYSLQTSSKAMQVFQNCRLSLAPELRKIFHALLAETELTFMRKVENARNIMVVKEDAPFGGQQMCKMYLESFLLLAARQVRHGARIPAFRSREDYEANLYQTILLYLEENLYTDITIEQLCRKLNYSRTYISALFRKYAGTSVIQYYNRLKVREAKRMLESRSVTETAECLGFGTPYYFSRVFSRIEGVSPSQYKKEHGKKEAVRDDIQEGG